MEEKKKTVHFNIIKNDPLDGHKGYNAGVLNLENVTPVFIDVAEQEAFIDIGAMHAKSKVEKGLICNISFLNSFIKLQIIEWQEEIWNA